MIKCDPRLQKELDEMTTRYKCQREIENQERAIEEASRIEKARRIGGDYWVGFQEGEKVANIKLRPSLARMRYEKDMKELKEKWGLEDE